MYVLPYHRMRIRSKRCWLALSDARLIELHSYSYRLDRTFKLTGCDACDAIDYIRDNEDPPRIPICGKCGSKMKVLEEDEDDSIHGLALTSLTNEGRELMQKVEQGECIL